MKAHVITMTKNKASLASSELLLRSHAKVGNQFPLERWDATTPATVVRHMKQLGTEWKHPNVGTRLYRAGDTTLVFSAYKTRDPLAREACFASHARLWALCVARQEPLIIMEEDSVWTSRFLPHLWEQGKWGAVGLNSPLGATRRARRYHEVVQMQNNMEVVEVPKIDEDSVPMGMAGASAYLIFPDLAEEALDWCRSVGAQANDSVLVRQLFPGRIGQVTNYLTKVRGTVSTLA